MPGAFHLTPVPSTQSDARLLMGVFEGPPSNRRKWGWIIALVLALLFHALLLATHPDLFFPVPPQRMQVEQIDANKLEQIRKQWRAKTPEKLLLDKDKNRPKEKEIPKDAKYFSDRNIRVEKEQRAKKTAILPAPDQTAPQKKVEPKTKSLPELKDLGIPMKLDSRPQVAKEEEKGNNQKPMVGGDQYADEKNLPEGSENLLNAQESIYYSFFSRIYETIGPIWQSKIHDEPPQKKLTEGDYTTQVDVVFDAEGNLIAVNHLHDSGIPQFDSAVDRAWKMAGRFPNPPKGLLNGEGQVHTGWNFTVQVGAGFAVDLPPTRTY